MIADGGSFIAHSGHQVSSNQQTVDHRYKPFKGFFITPCKDDIYNNNILTVLRYLDHIAPLEVTNRINTGTTLALSESSPLRSLCFNQRFARCQLRYCGFTSFFAQDCLESSFYKEDISQSICLDEKMHSKTRHWR